MKVVLQRVSEARVEVDGACVGAIERGVLLLLGVGPEDTEAHGAWLAGKIAGLRIFPDDDGKMNRSLAEVGGGALVVSQFTLFGDCSKGRRPSFVGAAPPAVAIPLYERFCAQLDAEGIPVQRGIFGADMKVSLLNDGPVTLILER